MYQTPLELVELEKEYQALVKELLSTGYKEEMYPKYQKIKNGLKKYGTNEIQTAGINLSLLELVEQKHQEEIAKSEVLSKKLTTKYVQILEQFILNNNDDSVLSKINDYKDELAKLPKDMLKQAFNNEKVFDKINNHFDSELEQNDKSELEDVIPDLSKGLHLEDEPYRLEYRKRLVEAFTKKLVLKIKDIVSNNKSKLKEDGYIDIKDVDLATYLFAEAKAPDYIIEENKRINNILIKQGPGKGPGFISYTTNYGNLVYNTVDKTIYFTPLVYCVEEHKYEQTKISKKEFENYAVFTVSLKLEDLTNEIFYAINYALKKDKIELDYGIYEHPGDFIHPNYIRRNEDEELNCQKVYNIEYRWESAERYKQSAEALKEFKSLKYNDFEIPYYFRIIKK